MSRLITIILLGVLMFNCAGNKPKPDWTSSQYFKYAKEMFEEEDYYEASNEFTVVVLRYAGSAVADSAQFFLAKSHFHMKEYLIAAVEFEKLVNNMSRSSLVPDAQFMMAESYFELSPRPELDQKYSDKAVREYQNFIEDNPTSPLKEKAEKRIAELRDKMAEKKWISADIYRRMREYSAALIYFDQILEKYYDTEWADDAMFGKIETYLDMEDYNSAKLEIEKFTAQFALSELKSEAQKKLLEIPETEETMRQ